MPSGRDCQYQMRKSLGLPLKMGKIEREIKVCIVILVIVFPNQ